MPKRNPFLYSVLLTLVVWLFFSWPLPEHLFTGIPSSSTNVEKHSVRRMIQGDHLQLHYFYWLFSDMLAGKTPFFHNIYEFNTGDDSARRSVGSYNMPLSFVYAVGRSIGGRAFGWNLTSFISLWFTTYITSLLLLRFTKHSWIAILFAAISITLPYRWITLYGGSPTGFAMMWVPLLIYGVDRLARDNSFTGGLLAGIAVFLAYWSDLHIFFFSVLIIPAWYLVGFCRKTEFFWREYRYWVSMLKAILPLALILLVLGVMAGAFRNTAFADTTMAHGRTLREIAVYSASPESFILWRGAGTEAHVYIGIILPLLLISSGFLLLFRLLKAPRLHIKHALLVVLVWLQLAGIIILALGPNGLMKGILFVFCRAVIPSFNMIRQPDKIFCLLPPVLAVAATIAVVDLMSVFKTKLWRILLVLTVGTLSIIEYGCQVRPTVCLLDTSQPAYEAVVDDAEQCGYKAHVLIIPLWPGDSSLASLYEHYVSLYRIRMVNGYSPVVSHDYLENIFCKFGKANLGILTNADLNELKNLGVNYIILHEDAFPEKVSPFPVVFTLKKFLNHPRLRLLKQSQNIWVFKILSSSEEHPEIGAEWNMFFSARKWEAENIAEDDSLIKNNDSASAGKFAILQQGGSIQTKHVSVTQSPGLRWIIRARGKGTLLCTLRDNNRVFQTDRVNVDSRDWIWLNVPVTSVQGSLWLPLHIAGESGSVDIDIILLTAGVWQCPSTGQSIDIPAPCFFHAGYTDMKTGSVVLRKDYDPAEQVFYGPKLPLDKGCYEIEFVYDTDAKPGTLLGRFGCRICGHENNEWVDVNAGSGATYKWVQKQNVPIFMAFWFLRNADIAIRKVTIKKVSDLDQHSRY